MDDTVGPWRLLERLGAGGMGTVFRARHAVDGRIVALKTGSGTPGAAAALRREARVLAGLRHPGVVPLVEDGSADEVPWLALAVLEGPTLARALEGVDGRWGEAALRRLGWIADLAVTLAHLHAAGLVHGDLKPSNVVIVDGRAMLVDFGLVAARGPRTDPDTILAGARVAGTAAFLAPERVRGAPFDARADLYALGCLAWAVVTGRPPFEEDSAFDLFVAHLTRDPGRLSSRVPGAPPALDDLLAALLEKEPARRLGHAVTVAHRLRALGAPGPQAPGPTAAPLFEPALHGRSRELAALEAEVSAALRTPGRLLVLVGESGLGKSRLASALTASFLQSEGRRVLVGGATALQSGTAPVPSGRPLELFLEPLRTLADLAGVDPVLAHRLAKPAAVLAPLVPFLASVAGPPVPDVDSAASARRRVVEAVVEALDAGQRDTPTLLVLDDLQWADELSLAALAAIRRSLGPRPWLVLGLARAESDDGWRAALAESALVVLDRLGDPEVEEMVSELLGQAPAPALLGWVRAHASGNPLFVGECLRGAVADGALALGEDGAWAFSGGLGPLPSTIDDLVGARLAALSARGRAVLWAAAVLGRSSPVARLARLVGGPVEAELEELHRRAITTGADPVVFVHDRLVERAYATVPEAERRRLHGLAATVVDDPAAEGWHLERAGDPDGAGRAFARAGELAAARHLLAEAEHRWSEALRLASGAEAAALEVKLAGRIDLPRGLHDRARERVLRALPDLPADRRLDAELLAARALGRNPGAAIPALEAVRRAAERAGRSDLVASAWSEAGAVLARSGRPLEALEHHRRALALSAGDRTAELLGRQRMATVLGMLGRNQEALDLLDEVLIQVREDQNPSAEASALSSRGNSLSFLGRHEDAVEAYRAAHALQVRIGNRTSQAALLGNWASALHHLGRYDEALVQLEEALVMHQESADKRYEGITERSLASNYLAQGRVREAREHAALAEEALRQANDPLWSAHAINLRSRLALLDGETGAALELADRAIDLYRAIGARVELADGLSQRVRCLQAIGAELEPTLGELRALAAQGAPGSMLRGFGDQVEELLAGG